MKEILEGINYEVIKGNTEEHVSDITIDSRKANKDSVFIALSGVNFDAHDFIKSAYENGCRNFIVEKNIDLEGIDEANIIKVDNTRANLATMSANFYHHPANELITIGITGTKGKTTTAQLIKNIIESTGEKCGLIGTLGVFVGDEHYKTMNTTPESIDIQKYMRKMADSGCKAVVMEVSSQALKYNRVKGLNFDYGIFTNLSEDHIGENEHPTYEDYRDSKSKLFSQCTVGILNKDSQDYQHMVKNAKCKIKTFGIETDANYKVTEYNFLHENGKIGMHFIVNDDENYTVYTPGKFSVYNSLCAISVAREMKIPEKNIKETLENFSVKGRVEPVNISDKFTLLIDYAHEAMSLESLLTTIKEYKPKRIVTLFGCGGNRSKLRRYEMGEISGKYSDLTIITEDNSRFEDVMDIINDIKTGINKTDGEYVVVPNRKDAIRYAIENAMEGDIILLCGKGHEDYQEIRGVRHHMDERELIQDIVNELQDKKTLIRK